MKVVDVRGELPTHPTKTYRDRPLNAIYYIAIHHSLTDDLPGGKDVFSFARYHINQNDWPGIGYHYVVDADGVVYKCNDAGIHTYHVGKHNRSALGICLVGDFREHGPPEIQYKAAIELVQKVKQAYNIKINNILGHSEFPGYSWKKCPAIDMDELRERVKK